MAVNAAVTLQRPLLVKGEPGTGKTELARQVAQSLDLTLIEWHEKSATRVAQGLYEYDAVSRLRDSQLGDPRSALPHMYGAFSKTEQDIRMFEKLAFMARAGR